MRPRQSPALGGSSGATSRWLRGGFGALRGGNLLFWRSEQDLERGLPAHERLSLGSAAALRSLGDSASASDLVNVCYLTEPNPVDRKLGAQLVVVNIAAAERWALAFADDNDRTIFEQAVRAVGVETMN